MAKSRTVDKDLSKNCGTLLGNKPGAYRLDVAEIDYGGKSHGIAGYVQKVLFFEDIDKFGITGWVELLDVDNLISGFMKKHTIVGQELLKLKFRTLGSHLPVDHTKHPLCIHKIENLRPYDQSTGSKSVSTQQYRLHFCSPEVMNNDRIRVSQAYQDTYSEIVKDNLKNHLHTRKDVWLEETKDIHKVVIPNMHPFDAINWILKRCRSKSNDVPNYNFYETSKGYRFKTMHNQAPSGKRGRSYDYQTKFTFSPTQNSGNYLKDMLTAKDYKFVRIGDTYSAINDGMFASKSIEHDSYYKNYTVNTLDYLIDAPIIKARYIKDKDAPIRKGSVYVPTGMAFEPQYPLNESVGFTEFPDSRIFLDSTGTHHAHDYVTSGGDVKTNDARRQPLQTASWQMQHKHDRYTQLQIIINGISGLQVGDAIELETPHQGTDKSEPIDRRWSTSGYYIIRLVHKLDLRAANPVYECVLDCSPKQMGRYTLPDNAKFSGKSDGRTGSLRDFKNKTERTVESP